MLNWRHLQLLWVHAQEVRSTSRMGLWGEWQGVMGQWTVPAAPCFVLCPSRQNWHCHCDQAACCVCCWLLQSEWRLPAIYLGDCSPLPYPWGSWTDVSLQDLSHLTWTGACKADIQAVVRVNTQPVSCSEILLICIPPRGPCPLHHNWCDLWEAAVCGRWPSAAGSPSLPTGSFLQVGRQKHKPHGSPPDLCVDWDLCDASEQMRQKINTMCFNYYLCFLLVVRV